MKNFTLKIFGFFALMLFASSISAQAPFWSEDFDGGLPADWTALEVAGNMNASSNWVWTDAGPMGQFANAPLASTSAANGWMLFDSDLNCSGNQNVWLISPKIDLTSKNIVILQFENRYQEFNSLVRLQVSTDSAVWTSYPLFASVGNGGFSDGATGANPHKVSMNITGQAANESSVWFAFEYLADSTTVQGGTDIGCGYAWQIDDVGLLDYDPTPATDLSLGEFFYPPLSYATPSSQIATDTMGFSADVSNLGSADATNVVLKATVTNSSGTILFADSVIANVIPFGTVDSTLIVPTVYPPSNVESVYTISYTVYSLDDQDFDMSNNNKSEQYRVTENLWSKEAAATIAYRPGVPAGSPTVDYDIGNMYWTSNDWVETYYATKLDFTAATNPGDGALSTFTTTIVLLEVDENEVATDWNDFDTDNNFFFNEGLTIRALDLHQYTGANFAMQSIDLVDVEFETPGVELKPGNRYLVLASYTGANNKVFHGFSEEISYVNQVSTVIYNGQWFLGGFGPEPAAVLRMTLSIDPVDVKDKLLPEGSITIYPNPVNDVLNVEVSFEKPELANVTLADINGKVIKIDILKNALNEKRQYDVSDLAAGTYIIKVATAEGTRTKKFVVQK